MQVQSPPTTLAAVLLPLQFGFGNVFIAAFKQSILSAILRMNLFFFLRNKGYIPNDNF